MIGRTRRVKSVRGLGVILAVTLGVVVCAAVAQAKQTPSIAFNPSTWSFGSVAGGTSSETFTLTNTGGSASAALSISLSGSPAFAITADGCKGSLGPNKSCTVTVTYQAGASGSSDAATLTAQGNKAAANATAALTGNSFASFSEMSCVGGCTVFTSTSTGSVNVVAAGAGASTVQAGIASGTLACGNSPGSLDEDPNTYTVLSSSSTYGKTVTISYPASLTVDTTELSGTHDGDMDFDDVEVCFQAPYDFPVVGGGMASSSSAGYTGFLADCSENRGGPCVDRTASTFTGPDESGIFQFSMVVDIPSGEPGDPRMN